MYQVFAFFWSAIFPEYLSVNGVKNGNNYQKEVSNAGTQQIRGRYVFEIPSLLKCWRQIWNATTVILIYIFYWFYWILLISFCLLKDFRKKLPTTIATIKNWWDGCAGFRCPSPTALHTLNCSRTFQLWGQLHKTLSTSSFNKRTDIISNALAIKIITLAIKYY